MKWNIYRGIYFYLCFLHCVYYTVFKIEKSYSDFHFFISVIIYNVN